MTSGGAGAYSGQANTPTCSNGKAYGSGTITSESVSFFVGGATVAYHNSFQDGQFTVQNLGQLYTTVTLSGDYLLNGFLRDYGQIVGTGTVNTHSSLSITMEIWSSVPNTPNPSAGPFFDYSWSPPDCSNAVYIGYWSCKNDVPVTGDQTFSHTFNLSPGTYYMVVFFDAYTKAEVLSAGDAGAFVCFNNGGDCTGGLPGGNNPVSATTSCPSGVSSPCYYVQLKDATYQLDDHFGGTASFNLVPQHTATSNPTSYSGDTGANWGVVNPQNAFAPDGQYTAFDDTCSYCYFSDAGLTYSGYSGSLVAGAKITKVEVLALHYEVVTFATHTLTITASFGTTSHLTLYPQFRSTSGLDTFDITSLKASWTQTDLGNINLYWYTSLGTDYLDWLALRVTYTLPSIYQNGPSWSQPLNITVVNGFSSTLSISANVATNGVQTLPTTTLSQNSLSVSSTPSAPGLPASYIVTLSVSATASTSPGNYTITVTASGNGIAQVAYIEVLVALVDPAVSLSLSHYTVIQGANNVITLTSSEVNFGNVAFPAETVYFLSNGNQVASWTPSTPTLLPGQSVSGSASWNVQSLSAGIYNVTAYVQPIQYETSNSLATDRMTARLDVSPAGSDFSISSSLNTVFVARGEYGQIQINLSPVSGFTGGVTSNGSLTSAGLSWNLQSVSPLVGGQRIVYVNGTMVSTTIYINATQTATLGPSNINIAVSSDLPLSHSIPLTVVVLSQTLQFTWNSQQFSGVNATLTSSFSVNTPANLLVGTTSLTEKNVTSGSTIFSGSVSMSISFNSNGVARFVAETPNAPYWLGVGCGAKVNATSSCSGFQRTVDLSYVGSGTINIVDIGLMNYQYGRTPNSPVWNPVADLLAAGMVNIVDVSIENNWYGTQVFLMTPNIVSLTSQSNNMVFQTGSSSSMTITAASQNGWSGNLRLTPSVAPSGPTCSLSTTSGTLTNGGTLTSTLNCASSVAGTFSVAVSGSNTAGLGNFVLVHLNVTDFSVSLNPTSATTSHGSSTTSTATLRGLYGFSGQVSLAVSAGSLGASLSTSMLVLSSNGLGTATLTVTSYSYTVPGTYIVTLTATSGSITHMTNFTVTVT